MEAGAQIDPIERCRASSPQQHRHAAAFEFVWIVMTSRLLDANGDPRRRVRAAALPPLPLTAKAPSR
jgi:hypothetical protein